MDRDLPDHRRHDPVPEGRLLIFGANVPGKTKTVMFYIGGLANYRAQLAEVEGDGFRGFEFAQAAVPVPA